MKFDNILMFFTISSRSSSLVAVEVAATETVTEAL